MEKERWEKAKNIFEQAMAIAPDARVNFLDEVCLEDKTVRREVEELLSSFDEAKSFLETPIISKKTNELENGQILGHYEIIKPIGAGGMGEVFLAKDTRLKRNVALKLLSAEFTADKERLRRFEQEAFAASSLNHPNILTIYEIGAADEMNFIATEFIEGETLREFAKSEDLTFQKIAEIAAQVVSALSAAHESGIVHRDIKPENIMIRRDRIVKVLDFGLAKTIRKVDADKSTLVQTKQGMVMGTVAYMSPEQTRGKEIDARSDLWSFGVVLYEMIAGKTPFDGETASDVIAAILKTNPEQLPAETPEELQRIVGKLLRKEKDERYQTATDLLADLKTLKRDLEFAAKLERDVSPATNKTIIENQEQQTIAQAATNSAKTVESQTTSSAEYVVNQVSKHKHVAVAVLMVLLLGVVTIGYYFTRNNSANKTDDTNAIDSIAVLPFANASQDPNAEYLSDGITESLINRLSQLPSLKVMSRSSVFRYKGKETDAQKVGNELNVQAVLTGDVKQIGDQLSINVELIDVKDNHQIWGEQYVRKFADVFAVQSEIAQEISTNLRLKLTGAEQQKLDKHYTDNPEAYQLYLRGRFYWNKRTAEGMIKGIEYFNQAIKIDPNYALAYSGLADCYILRSAPFTTKERVEKGSAVKTPNIEPLG
ncbi:hypothetical protein BH10ACI1_BH10ACI1_33540 [soil metagenome]